MVERAVIHLNIADFAVQVERSKDSTLRGLPLIVAPQGAARSLIHDMSEEAFAAGVRKHMLLPRARRLCGRAKVLAPDWANYQKAMAGLLRLCNPYTPLVEAEEASGHLFLDISGTGRLHGPPQDVARRLRREIKASLSFEPIWTVASNKLVAKVASRLVKPVGEYIVPAGDEEAFLRPLPLHLLPGLEDRELTALAEFNFKRVRDVLGWSPAQLRVLFGGRAPQIHQLLRGRDNAPVLPAERAPSRLCLEHQFPEDTNDYPLVERTLYILCERAGARLRGMGRAARQVGVAVDYSDGMRVARGAWHGGAGTDNDAVIFELARAALDLAWRRRIRLRHLRLICGRLGPASGQLGLLGLLERAEPGPGLSPELLRAMDHIRQRHGQEKIRLGRVMEQA